MTLTKSYFNQDSTFDPNSGDVVSGILVNRQLIKLKLNLIEINNDLTGLNLKGDDSKIYKNYIELKSSSFDLTNSDYGVELKFMFEQSFNEISVSSINHLYIFTYNSVIIGLTLKFYYFLHKAIIQVNLSYELLILFKSKIKTSEIMSDSIAILKDARSISSTVDVDFSRWDLLKSMILLVNNSINKRVHNLYEEQLSLANYVNYYDHSKVNEFQRFNCFDMLSDLNNYFSIKQSKRFTTNLGGALFIVIIVITILLTYIKVDEVFYYRTPLTFVNTLSEI